VMDLNQTPPFGQLATQFLIILFFEDLFLFMFHWLLHHPLLYRFHKLHHEYKTTVNLAGFHFNLGEVFITQTIGSFFVYKFTSLYAPIHISFIVCFLALRTNDANTSHSGYNFSWAPMQVIPFCANDDYHDFHHTQNTENYAPYLRIWDTVFGTNENFRRYKAKQNLEKIDKVKYK